MKLNELRGFQYRYTGPVIQHGKFVVHHTWYASASSFSTVNNHNSHNNHNSNRNNNNSYNNTNNNNNKLCSCMHIPVLIQSINLRT